VEADLPFLFSRLVPVSVATLIVSALVALSTGCAAEASGVPTVQPKNDMIGETDPTTGVAIVVEDRNPEGARPAAKADEQDEQVETALDPIGTPVRGLVEAESN
jgi:hypothetical protein